MQILSTVEIAKTWFLDVILVFTVNTQFVELLVAISGGFIHNYFPVIGNALVLN